MPHFNYRQYRISIAEDSLTKHFSVKWKDKHEKSDETFSIQRRKIYLVTINAEILYVGETKTSMKTRFQRGCTSFNHYKKEKKARNGYLGYKWLDKDKNASRDLIVHVAVFSQEFDSAEQRKIIEAIEGELVFLTRERFGYWPKFQNEIHFENHEIAKTISVEIFQTIQKSLSQNS